MTESERKKIEAKVVKEVKKIYLEYGLKQWETRLIRNTVKITLSEVRLLESLKKKS